MYWNPGWGGWYWYAPGTTDWVAVEADDAPEEPDDNTPAETVPPPDDTPPPGTTTPTDDDP